MEAHRSIVLLALVILVAAAASSTAMRVGALTHHSVLSSSKRAYARFHPNGLRIEECSSTDFPCFRQAFGNLAYREGAQAALAELQKIHDANGIRIVTANCHTLAHEIGRGALAADPRHPGEVLGQGAPICGGGYEHGILESVFASVDPTRMAQTAKQLCGSIASRGPREACRHGVGHGAIYFTQFDVARALKICDVLQRPGDLDMCGTGVFMENLSSLPRIRNPEWLSTTDLAQPCPRAPEAHKWACYRQIASRMVQSSHTWPETARLCSTVERRYQPSCVGGMGMIASTTGHTASGIVSICEMAFDYNDVCFENAVGELKNMYSNQPARRFAVCDRARAAVHAGSLPVDKERATSRFLASNRCRPGWDGPWNIPVVYG